jgi:hypothetical protein
MQNRTRRAAAVVTATVALSLVLTACDNSDDSKTDNPAPHGTSAQMKPIEAFPELGTNYGVETHGKSVDDNPTNKGISYTCSRTLKTITVGFNKTIDYNGIRASFKSNLESNPPSEPINNNTIAQESVSLTISDVDKNPDPSISNHPIALIVDPISVDTSDKKKTIVSPVDQYVVNMPSSKATSLLLETSRFTTTTGGYIGDIRLCVPAS